MSQTQETPESLNDDETAPAVPVMTTVERAEMLLRQDAAIRDRIGAGATLDEAVDPSNKEFGPLAHPEQVQMRVAKRAMMLEAGMQPYPVHLDVPDTIEAVRAKYDGKLEAGQEPEDVVGIAELAHKILHVWRETASNRKRGLTINLATAYFVPKPFTPFQWEAQITPEEYLRRVHLLQANLHAKCVDYRYHESDLSRLEAVMARGDRRVGQALLEAHRLGCRLDGWDEYFDYEKWLEAFRRAGLDLDFYTTRGFAADELLPWQTIDVGVTTKYLLHEREKALRSEATPDCRTHCNGCGARMLSERRLCDESPAV